MKQLWDEHIAYLKDNPKGYWFKRKLYGWGWTPAKPAGWAIVGGYLLVLFGMALYAEKTDCIERDPVTFFGAIAGVTILFLVVVFKTGETPKWQWGKSKD